MSRSKKDINVHLPPLKVPIPNGQSGEEAQRLMEEDLEEWKEEEELNKQKNRRRRKQQK